MRHTSATDVEAAMPIEEAYRVLCVTCGRYMGRAMFSMVRHSKDAGTFTSRSAAVRAAQGEGWADDPLSCPDCRPDSELINSALAIQLSYGARHD